jgi:4'-phosphopantetheinyl transferase
MIEIYALNLSEKIGSETVAHLLPFVAKERQDRVRRFYRWEDSLRALFAELMIRNIILKKTDLSNDEISFSTNEYGKPFLNSADNLYFNLSHSGAWIVCAVDKKPVGIDVEEVAPIDLDISKNYFSKDEHSDLLSKTDKTGYFFTLWTLKESYIKIVGKGLSLPLNSFSIRFKDTKEIRIYAGRDIIPYIFFSQYDIDKKYKMALCAHHKNFPDAIIPVTTRELVESFLGDKGLSLER